MFKLIQALLLPMLLLSLPAQASIDRSQQRDHGAPAQTFRMATIAAVRSDPDGRIIDIWDKDTLFTSNQIEGDWIRVTGHFPASSWQPLEESVWIHRHYASTFQPRSSGPRSRRPAGITRYIEIDKSTFELKVIEERKEQREILFKTTVALGMDRCLPKERGGRCYHTEPGEYAVRWKVEDDEGIEWCIPKYMENEYPEAIARGERCYRGSIGTRALNIGKSYAIHGTSNPASIGTRASRGCVRAHNDEMEKIYSLMEVGDRVIIRE
jgi:hypothetical protein